MGKTFKENRGKYGKPDKSKKKHKGHKPLRQNDLDDKKFHPMVDLDDLMPGLDDLDT